MEDAAAVAARKNAQHPTNKYSTAHNNAIPCKREICACRMHVNASKVQMT